MIERKLSEMTYSKTFFEGLVNSVPNMVFIVDSKNNIKTVNQKALNLLGYELTDLNGKYIAMIFEKKVSLIK